MCCLNYRASENNAQNLEGGKDILWHFVFCYIHENKYVNITGAAPNLTYVQLQWILDVQPLRSTTRIKALSM